jgi:hypothetical protein
MKTLLKCTFGFALLGALQVACANPILIGSATLTGDQEVPPNGSSATGFISVSLDGNLLDVSLSFTGLTGAATAAHIYCCAPPGTNTIVALPFTGFPNTTSGTYSNTFDLTMTSTYDSAFLTAFGGTAGSAETALLAGIEGGLAYANIHNGQFPGGEIRGDLTSPVPEPSSLGTIALLLSGILCGIALRRPLRA